MPRPSCVHRNGLGWALLKSSDHHSNFTAWPYTTIQTSTPSSILSSTLINDHQRSSTTINVHQRPSTFINDHQRPLTFTAWPYTRSTTHINTHHINTHHVNAHQRSSTLINTSDTQVYICSTLWWQMHSIAADGLAYRKLSRQEGGEYGAR